MRAEVKKLSYKLHFLGILKLWYKPCGRIHPPFAKQLIFYTQIIPPQLIYYITFTYNLLPVTFYLITYLGGDLRPTKSGYTGNLPK